MQLFPHRLDYYPALEFAHDWGIALWLQKWANPSEIPCFDGSEEVVTIGKLFDYDMKRASALARAWGVNKITIHRSGTEKQHIDLVGKPLERALNWCVRLKAVREHL